MVSLPTKKAFWRKRGEADDAWTEVAEDETISPVDGDEIEVKTLAPSKSAYIFADTVVLSGSIQNLSIPFGTSININAEAGFSGGTNLVYTLIDPPEYLAINSNSGLISGTAPDEVSLDNVTIKASNSKYSASVSFNINITAVNNTPFNVLALGDSLSKNQSGYGPTPQIEITDANQNWTVQKTNPVTITMPSGHGITSPSGLHYFVGWVGMPELCELETTITVLSPTQIQLDGVDGTAWMGTYVRAGRIYPIENSSIVFNPNGFLNHLNMLTGGRYNFDPKYNRGVISDSVQNMVARLPFDIPTTGPRSLVGKVNCFVLYSPGRNDLSAGRLSPAIMADVRTCIDYMRANFGNDVPIITGTVTPNDAASSPIVAETIIHNAALLALEAEYPNLTVFDYDIEVNNGSGKWNSGDAVDTQHPSVSGALKGAQKCRDKTVPKHGYGVGFVADANQILVNPTFSGTGGTSAGNTNNGLAASWSGVFGGSHPASARETYKDANDKQVMRVSASQQASGVGQFTLRQEITSGIVVGRKYWVEAEISVLSTSNTGGKFTRLSANIFTRTAPALTGTFLGVASGTPVHTVLMDRLVSESANKPLFFKSPKIKMPVGATSLRCEVGVGYDSTLGDINGEFEIANIQVCWED